jgi:hypothetical protein
MFRINKAVLVIALALVAAPAARANQLGGPVLGYVLDPGIAALRIVVGIPGASAMGRPVELGARIRRAVSSVQHDYALAVVETTGQVVLARNLTGEVAVSEIPGVLAGGDALALSNDGTTAAIFSAAGASIQVLRGLPAAPSVALEFPTSALSDQSITALAISDFASVLVAFSNGESGSLHLLSGEGTPRFVSPAGSISGIAFSPGGNDAVTSDRLTNEVVLFSDVQGAAAAIRLAGAADGITAPFGVQLSRDGRTAFVPNAESGTVSIVSLAGGAPLFMSCQCRPTVIDKMHGDSVFALTENRDEQPLILFDGAGSEPRFVVVPPAGK